MLQSYIAVTLGFRSARKCMHAHSQVYKQTAWACYADEKPGGKGKRIDRMGENFDTFTDSDQTDRGGCPVMFGL